MPKEIDLMSTFPFEVEIYFLLHLLPPFYKALSPLAFSSPLLSLPPPAAPLSHYMTIMELPYCHNVTQR